MEGIRGGAVFAVALGFVVAVGSAAAQSFPARPVRIIVPTSPGGGNDFVARHLGQKLGERLGQQFIVENRPGAGGTIGTAQAAKAAPDGYTLLLGFVGQLAMSPHAEKGGYDPLKDFVGVSLLASSYHILGVHPSLPVMSHVRSKRIMALAVTSPERSSIAPEVPTLVELGVRGVEAPSWYSIVAPAAFPTEVIGKLHAEIVTLAARPDYREPLERQALEPTTTTPEEFAAFLKAEYDKWGRVIQALKLQ